MATKTLGSAATNTFTAISFSQSVADADFATIINAILGDKGPSASPIGAGYAMPGAFSRMGLLYVPGRGVLQALPGDFVAVDPTTGWPMLISAACAAGVGIVHT